MKFTGPVLLAFFPVLVPGSPAVGFNANANSADADPSDAISMMMVQDAVPSNGVSMLMVQDAAPSGPVPMMTILAAAPSDAASKTTIPPAAQSHAASMLTIQGVKNQQSCIDVSQFFSGPQTAANLTATTSWNHSSSTLPTSSADMPSSSDMSFFEDVGLPTWAETQASSTSFQTSTDSAKPNTSPPGTTPPQTKSKPAPTTSSKGGGPPIGIKAPASDQQNALAAHNAARAQFGEPPLKWDPGLAAAAQAYSAVLAELGKLQHGSVGENLYSASPPNTHEFLSATNAWLAEKPNYDGEPIPQGPFSTYGHYTQCVWTDTLRVGMGQTKINNTVYVVARYDPPGNVEGETPYPV
ncbi:PR-1-like protein [Thozetella sp. PMI_491]|nr:PR-1-like protein [Thozetella sp. PMI_491]